METVLHFVGGGLSVVVFALLGRLCWRAGGVLGVGLSLFSWACVPAGLFLLLTDAVLRAGW